MITDQQCCVNDLMPPGVLKAAVVQEVAAYSAKGTKFKTPQAEVDILTSVAVVESCHAHSGSWSGIHICGVPDDPAVA